MYSSRFNVLEAFENRKRLTVSAIGVVDKTRKRIQHQHQELGAESVLSHLQQLRRRHQQNIRLDEMEEYCHCEQSGMVWFLERSCQKEGLPRFFCLVGWVERPECQDFVQQKNLPASLGAHQRMREEA